MPIVEENMESSIVTTAAALAGSLMGAAASIITTWMTQRTESARSQTETKLRERESLYGKFIAEASRLTVEALSHSLEKPDTFVKLYGILGRIRLIAAGPVLAAAEACVREIMELYAKPNMSIEEIRAAFEQEHFDPVKDLSSACRAELLEIAGGFHKRGSATAA
jgi:hypothetical protein